MDIIMAVLDATSVDARNPCKYSTDNILSGNVRTNSTPVFAVIKEWSILAIRNLCENNQENQTIIRQLTKVGDADNSDILKELNLDLGSLRISSN